MAGQGIECEGTRAPQHLLGVADNEERTDLAPLAALAGDLDRQSHRLLQNPGVHPAPLAADLLKQTLLQVQVLTSVLTVRFVVWLPSWSVYGEPHLEARLSGGGVYPDLAAVPRDDAPHDVEARARALADTLGGEERLEDAAL